MRELTNQERIQQASAEIIEAMSQTIGECLSGLATKYGLSNEDVLVATSMAHTNLATAAMVAYLGVGQPQLAALHQAVHEVYEKWLADCREAGPPSE